MAASMGAAKKSREVLGPPSVVVEVTRIAGERPRGSGTLYAYGYADFADYIGVKPWRLATAVHHGRLELLSFLEVAFARQHGIAAVEQLEETNPRAAKALRRLRPDVVRETVRAKVSATLRPYGLGDLWAFGHGDIALQTWQEEQAVWNAQKLGHFRIDVLGSVLDYVVTSIPEKQATSLGLSQ